MLPLRGVWPMRRAGPREAELAYFRARVMCEVCWGGRAGVRARAIACALFFPPLAFPPPSGASACARRRKTHTHTHMITEHRRQCA